MKSIPNTKLTEEEFNFLITKCKVGFGGEATICEGSKDYTLYKLFSDFHTPKPMGDNKEKKIIELYNRQIDYTVKPLSTVSINGVIVGYEMTNEYDLDSANSCSFTNEELVYFLKESKRILEYFSKKGIIYGDVATRNILINKDSGRLVFCDMDNIKLDNLEMDLLPPILAHYSESRGIDDGVQPYMHNIMTLKAFKLDMLCSTNYELKKHFKRTGRKIVDSMKKPDDFNGEYIVEHIKKRVLKK